ncbi:MAG: helix-turn-helix transcriptional regulator [Verrucomicrobiaceae bacterium]|nr:helix-turn-helix transcriptional regulator [Verrucomicrobiaceae bacterium]
MKNAPQQAMFYHRLGQNIRKCRKRHKLSQDALAKLIGLTRTSLTNIESGRQHPPLHTFCDIVEQLKVDVLELLPRAIAATEPVDVKAMVGMQLRGDKELAFIESGIGIKTGGSNGNS